MLSTEEILSRSNMCIVLTVNPFNFDVLLSMAG